MSTLNSILGTLNSGHSIIPHTLPNKWTGCLGAITQIGYGSFVPKLETNKWTIVQSVGALWLVSPTGATPHKGYPLPPLHITPPASERRWRFSLWSSLPVPSLWYTVQKMHQWVFQKPVHIDCHYLFCSIQFIIFHTLNMVSINVHTHINTFSPYPYEANQLSGIYANVTIIKQYFEKYLDKSCCSYWIEQFVLIYFSNGVLLNEQW